MLKALQVLLEQTYQTLGIVGSQDLTAVDTGRLLPREQADEVEDEFALLV